MNRAHNRMLWINISPKCQPCSYGCLFLAHVFQIAACATAHSQLHLFERRFCMFIQSIFSKVGIFFVSLFIQHIFLCMLAWFFCFCFFFLQTLCMTHRYGSFQLNILSQAPTFFLLVTISSFWFYAFYQK